MMELRRALTGTPQRLYWDFLGSITFEGTVQERHTITPQPSWSKYDFLFLKTNLMITSQEGQTTGNWLWHEIYDGTNRTSNYQGNGQPGARGEDNSVVVIRNSNEGKWYISTVNAGRPASMESSATLDQITVTFGIYYGNTYATMTGTVDIYGGSFREGSVS